MSYGIDVFSQNGTKVFGSELRTTNLEHTISLTLGSQATSQFFPMADENDSTKVVVVSSVAQMGSSRAAEVNQLGADAIIE